MTKTLSIRLAVLAFACSILLPVNSSVKLLSSNTAALIPSAAWSGSPLPAPVPNPPLSTLTARSGSPLPAPVPNPPLRQALARSGSPLPAPVPNPPLYDTVARSGSPLPAPVPNPPGSATLSA